MERVSNDQVGNDYGIYEGNLNVDGKATKTQNAHCKFHIDCGVKVQARIASNSKKANLGHGEDSKFVMISQFGGHNGNIDPYRARLHYARNFSYLKTEEAKAKLVEMHIPGAHFPNDNEFRSARSGHLKSQKASRNYEFTFVSSMRYF